MTDRRREGRTRLACAAIGATIAILAAGAAWSQTLEERINEEVRALDSNSIYMRTGRIDTMVDRVALADRLAERNVARRLVIQLDGPMTSDRREKLAASGVRILDYLPVNSYIANIENADALRAADLDFVQWSSTYQSAWKIDPEIGVRDYQTQERKDLGDAGIAAVVITLFADSTEEDVQRVIKTINAFDGADVVVRDELGGNPILNATIPLWETPRVASIQDVQYIEEAPEITPRNSTNRWIVQSNQTNVTPLYENGLRGEGQIVGILDGRLDQNHCSFSDTNPIGPTHRKIVAYNSSSGADVHGTHVGGTVVGDNGDNTATRGVAYEGKLAFNTTPSFNEAAIVGRLNTHHNQGARVHTNSWGNDGTTSYDSLARGFDVFLYDNEDDIVLLAVTNGGVLRNPENAKNLLACGASQDTPNQGSHCTAGIGPTIDGRRKPEIYAPGCSTQSASAGSGCGLTSLTGTSMATPALAGVAMLVRQYYVDGFYPSGGASASDGFTPSGALIKATMLNSATDMTGIAEYPSNLEGWGRVLQDDSLFFTGDSRSLFIKDVRNASGMSTGQNDVETLNVISNSEQLRVTLVWTDAPAAAGASFAPINDLNLEVVAPDGTTYLGNVFSGGSSTAGGSADDRNNVEQVHVNNPAPGAWDVRVIANGVNVGTQGFALVVTGDVALGPAPLTIAASNTPELIAPGDSATFDVVIDPRDSDFVGGSAMLHYRYDGGAFQTTPLVNVGGMNWEATLPTVDCPDVPEFYVSAESVEDGVATSPSGAPSNFFDAAVGVVTTVLIDDAEGDLGWTMGLPGDTASTGVWERVDPIGTAAQPENDHTDAGSVCFVTGQQPPGGTLGTNDVDFGPTTLLTPVFSLTPGDNATISYWRWFSNSSGAAPNTEVFQIDITSDGVNWENVETVGPAGAGTSGGWVQHSFNPAAHVTLSSTMQMRFIATDPDPGSVVEAAIDDFSVTTFSCTSVVDPCPWDLDGDGAVGSGDLASLIGTWGQSGAADFDGSGTIGSEDLAELIGNWGPCP